MPAAVLLLAAVAAGQNIPNAGETLSPPPRGYANDLSGNLTYDPGSGHSYQYDAAGRLLGADGGSTASYGYDAEGRRVSENVGGVVKEYMYGAGPQSLTVLDGNQNVLQAEFRFNGRGLVSVVVFDHADTLGTVRARTNMSQAVVERDTSWAYGEFRVYGNGIGQLHFTGQYQDTETGLDDFGARYYSSTLGRFLTPDWSEDLTEPIPYANLADPQSLNLYEYAGNNPVTNVDKRRALADLDPQPNLRQSVPRLVFGPTLDDGGVERQGRLQPI
ncbi:MAG: RHS repeat-associated core domain-containing protein [Terriglobales bacterium]